MDDRARREAAQRSLEVVASVAKLEKTPSQQAMVVIGSVEGAITVFFGGQNVDPTRQLVLIGDCVKKIKFDHEGVLMEVFNSDDAVSSELLGVLEEASRQMQVLVSENGIQVIPDEFLN